MFHEPGTPGICIGFSRCPVLFIKLEPVLQLFKDGTARLLPDLEMSLVEWHLVVATLDDPLDDRAKPDAGSHSTLGDSRIVEVL